MANCKAVVWPLSTPLHVTNHCKHKVGNSIKYGFVKLNDAVKSINFLYCKILLDRAIIQQLN